MNFTSDNCAGAAPEILAALARANEGAADSYGADEGTRRLNRRFAEFFERDLAVYPVMTGTAANALALATLVPPHGAIVCHAQSHVAVDECGAAEFFTHGAKILAIASDDGKLSPGAIEAALAPIPRGSVHNSQPACISITQASEAGTLYTPSEIESVARIAHGRGMTLHMDGARLANALATLGCAPADITWRAGVDALSFGATKNGAMGAEAVVFFDGALARDFEFRRKKSGHLLSKMRFVSAQLEACLDGGAWLKNAMHANALAARLAQGLRGVRGAEIVHPVQANMVFAHLPDETVRRLRAAGATFYDWVPPSGGRTLVRLVTSYATAEAEVEAFIRIAGA